MIVVYADGGGLGHLTRVQALRHTLGIGGEVTVLTSSHHVDDVRVAGGMRIVPIRIRRDDLAARRSWLQRTLADLAPSELIVDAFPAGLAGEIDAATVPSGTTTVHVARLLRWPAYRRLLSDRPLRYDRTYLLEALDLDHDAYVRVHSDRVDSLTLVDRPAPTSSSDAEVAEDAERAWSDVVAAVGHADARRPRWLIAHTGPAAEVVELVAYARDQAQAEAVAPVFVVASSSDAAPPAADDLVLVDRYPVWPLFAGADRVVTAAGFNTMRQLAAHRDRHRFLAMPRRFDDQVERARRAHRERDGSSAGVTPAGAPLR